MNGQEGEGSRIMEKRRRESCDDSREGKRERINDDREGKGEFRKEGELKSVGEETDGERELPV